MPGTPAVEPETKPNPTTRPDQSPPPPEREPIRREEPTEEPPRPHRTCPLDDSYLPKSSLRAPVD